MKKGQAMWQVIQWIILLVLLAVILWLIYRYLVKGIGQGTVKPLVEQTSEQAKQVKIFEQ